MYDESSQICCGERILEKWSNGMERRCCGSRLINVTQNIDCCGEEEMNMTTHFCCINQTSLKSDSMDCCFAEPYNKTTHHCVDDEVLPVNNNKCGAVIYDTKSSMKCCNEKLHNTSAFNVSTECCGTELYSIQHQKCCKGPWLPIPKENECCGQGSINIATHICCAGEGHLRSSTQTACCGKTTFDKTLQGCCGIDVYNKTKEKCFDEKIQAILEHPYDGTDATSLHLNPAYGICQICNRNISSFLGLIRSEDVSVCNKKVFKIYITTSTENELYRILNVEVKDMENKTEKHEKTELKVLVPCKCKRLDSKLQEYILLTHGTITVGRLLRLGDTDFLLPFKKDTYKIIERKQNKCNEKNRQKFVDEMRKRMKKMANKLLSELLRLNIH
ncbi:uncharacterized protein LOC134256816 [Saccostrea cucullata]|uniref:uncharacterized protein LOC134256816 n=1 Tax=Saccostrea cuccullata TaxID=36930 RepID=UPI002ED4492D